MISMKELDKDDIILGKFLLNQLPSLNVRHVRLYLCAPYSDTYEEVCHLFKNVFLKLREFCMSRYGIEFQVINLNWDVNNSVHGKQAFAESNLISECLCEIEKCKLQSIAVTFLGLIGDQYGAPFLPRFIEREHFTAVIRCLKEKNIDHTLLETVYKLNINYLSNRYEFSHEILSRENEKKLLELLQTGAQLAYEKKLINRQLVQELNQSALEKQMVEGAFKSEHKTDRVFSFVRINANRPSTSVNGANGGPFSLEHLRDKEINFNMPAEQIFRVRVDKNDQNYLKNMCIHYTKLFETLVDKYVQKNPVIAYDDLFNDILSNLAYIRLNRLNDDVTAATSSTQRILETLTRYVLDDMDRMPLVLNGEAGSGKTSILSTFVSNLYLQLGVYQGSFSINNHAIIFRFVGVDQKSSYLRALLKSICSQLYYVRKNLFKHTNVEPVPSRLDELKQYFKKSLATGLGNDYETKSAGKLIIVIDSLHDLLPNDYSFKLDWLPNTLNPNCKLILSVSNECKELTEKLRRKYTNPRSYLSLQRLSVEQMDVVLRRMLNAKNYRLEPDQLNLLVHLVQTRPVNYLHFKILSDSFLNWKSYTKIEECVLKETLLTSINYFLSTLEAEHGEIIVKHVLSYISIAHSGLTESELQDILSLDDHLLKHLITNDMIQLNANFLRMPCCLTTRILNAIANHLLVKPFYGMNTFCWRHKIFADAVHRRYLHNHEKLVNYLHKNIAKYYLDIWSNSKLKPISYEKRLNPNPNPEKLNIDKPIIKKYTASYDRLVPSQPLQFDDYHTHIKPRYNLRKLIQLPYHLAKANMIDELFNNVYFNANWLFTKLKAFDLYHLIYDFDLLKSDIEVNLVCECLKLAENAITEDVRLFFSQLTGRLLPFYDVYKNIRQLIDQCDAKSIVVNPIVPIGQIFKSPGWISGDFIDLGINSNDELIIDLCESDFNGRLLVTKNLNSASVKFYDLDLFEQQSEMFIGKCAVYLNRTGDYVCTIEKNSSFVMRRVENGELYGKVNFDRCEIGHVYTSAKYASLILRKVPSPLLIDLQSCSLLAILPYQTCFSYFSSDDSVLVVHSENSLHYHQMPSLRRVMSVESKEIPEKVLFTKHNTNLFVLLKDTKQVVGHELTLKKRQSQSYDMIQDRDIFDMKLSRDESLLLVCSTKCIYLFDERNLKHKLTAQTLEQCVTLDDVQWNFTGFGITLNNKVVYATVYTYLVCFDSQTGNLMRFFQSSLSANRIIRSLSSQTSNTFVSLLDNNKLLAWNLNCFDYDNNNKYIDFDDMKLFNSAVVDCQIPSVEHTSPVNSHVIVSYSNSYPDAKVQDLREHFSVKTMLKANVNEQYDDPLRSEIHQLVMDDTGRFIYMENDIKNFFGQRMPDEGDFVKKVCSVYEIDANGGQRLIESFTYIVRASPEARFQIRVKFFNKATNETYMLFKMVSSVNDFDPYANGPLDWTEFDSQVKVYGPLESADGLPLVEEFRLAGESLESDVCLTKDHMFASLTHECAKLYDADEPGVIKAKRYDVQLNTFEFFKRQRVQQFSLNEFLLPGNNNEGSNVYIDLRVYMNTYLLLVYSKQGPASNRYEYDYDLAKFKRDIRTDKGAIIYDPVNNCVLRRFESIFQRQSNVEKIIVAQDGHYALDDCWNLVSLNTGKVERNLKKNIEHLSLDFDMCTRFVLGGEYLLVCNTERDVIYVIRSKDSYVAALVKINDRVNLIRAGEGDRTILLGTCGGSILPLKLVVDLEQNNSLNNYIGFYRKSKAIAVTNNVASHIRISEDTDEKSSSFDRLDEEKHKSLRNDIKRVVHSAHAYKQLKSRDAARQHSALSFGSISQNSFASSGNATAYNPQQRAYNVHSGITKLNLATVSSGIKYAHTGTKACLIQ